MSIVILDPGHGGGARSPALHYQDKRQNRRDNRRNQRCLGIIRGNETLCPADWVGGDESKRYFIDGDLVERDINLTLATLIMTKGFGRVETRMTRYHNDVQVSLTARGEMTTDLRPALLVSLHVNGAASSGQRGCDTFWRAGSMPSHRAALEISSAMPKHLRKKSIWEAIDKPDVDGDEWLQRPAAVLDKHEAVPAVLCEIGYATHEADRIYILDNLSEIADHLHSGIEAALTALEAE